jgi:DNA (cytosine-5)-methyltransferase 1
LAAVRRAKDSPRFAHTTDLAVCETGKNDLIFQFQRLVRILKPKQIMLENVPGLLADRRLKRFTAFLVGSGYRVNTKILNVSEYGVPQAPPVDCAAGSHGDKSDFRKKVAEDSPQLGTPSPHAPGRHERDQLHDLPEQRSRVVASRIRRIPPNGGSRAALLGRLRLSCHKKTDGFHDVYGRMAWDQPAPTITTGCFNPSKGRFLHPRANRAITMREAALLQSFPEVLQIPHNLGKIRIATMIGNALPPRFIKCHARALSGTPQTPAIRPRTRTRTVPREIEFAATKTPFSPAVGDSLSINSVSLSAELFPTHRRPKSLESPAILPEATVAIDIYIAGVLIMQHSQTA